MAKFVIFFSYSNEAWARMIGSPGDRSAAVRQLLGSVDGSLESIYWMLGTHDGIAVADVPDSVSVAAVSIAITSTGAFEHVETHELFTQEQLAQARCSAPGQRRRLTRPRASRDSDFASQESVGRGLYKGTTASSQCRSAAICCSIPAGRDTA